MVLLPNLVYHLLNILICRFRLFCVNHMDIVIFLDLQRIALHFIGIKYQNNYEFPESLIITQDVHQFIPRRFDIYLRKLLQVVPCKYHVISVYQEKFLYSIFLLAPSFLRYTGDCLRLRRHLPLNLSISADKYFF